MRKERISRFFSALACLWVAFWTPSSETFISHYPIVLAFLNAVLCLIAILQLIKLSAIVNTKQES
jgi:hypothetical protein